MEVTSIFSQMCEKKYKMQFNEKNRIMKYGAKNWIMKMYLNIF